jgi:hypothetical protein
MGAMITRARVLLGAAALFAFCVVPIALGASEGSGGPQATASGTKGKVKKLNKRVKALEDQLAALQGEQGGARPPSGPAGGDLTGDYPNPAIAAGAVNSAKVAEGSLTGDDIDESSLGPVPDAVNLNGLQARAFQFAEDMVSTQKTFLSLGGLTLSATCAATGIEIVAGVPADSFFDASNGGTQGNVDAGVDSGIAFLVMRNGATSAGSTTASANVVTATIAWETDTPSPNCQLAGTALGRP